MQQPASLNLRGLISADGAVRLALSSPPRPGSPASGGTIRDPRHGLVLEVRSAAGVLAAWRPALTDRANKRYDGPLPAGRPLAFHLRLPIAADAEAIVARLHGEPVIELEIPNREPAFASDPKSARTADGVRLSWEMRDDAGLTYSVRASVDEEEWTTLASQLRKPEVEIPAYRLPGGERVAIEISATNGRYRTSRRLTIAGLSEASVDLVILQPILNHRFVAERPIRLEAAACRRGARSALKDTEYVWLVDGTEVGRERIAFWKEPVAGSHEIAVVARCGGAAGKKTLTLDVEPQEARKEAEK